MPTNGGKPEGREPFIFDPLVFTCHVAEASVQHWLAFWDEWLFPRRLQGGGEAMSEGENTGQSSRQVAREFLGPDKKRLLCRYLLYRPRDTGVTPRRWPLILFLHGAGERGGNIDFVRRQALPELLERIDDFSFIVVSPQCSAGHFWSDPAGLLALLDEIVATHDVDLERIYLTGISMGGYGTWMLATAAPERFAAIAPICGGGLPSMAETLREMPTWVFHGAKDNVVPLSESERMVRALSRLGGEVKFTIYPDADHDSWTPTYQSDKLYEWFLEHRRRQPQRPGAKPRPEPIDLE